MDAPICRRPSPIYDPSALAVCHELRGDGLWPWICSRLTLSPSMGRRLPMRQPSYSLLSVPLRAVL